MVDNRLRALQSELENGTIPAMRAGDAITMEAL
jgi:hypothetical protein